MKVSGVTFIKNGLSLGYPFFQAIQSIIPLCDEIVINVGFDDPACENDDGTFQWLQNELQGPQFIFIKSWWDPSLRKDGLILSEQTNIALQQCSGDIILYVQGDEVYHEQDYPQIHRDLLRLHQHPTAEGLIFQYHHFYGSTDIIKYTKKTYRREVRAIKNYHHIISWRDAQGFRKETKEKIKSLKTSAYVYHYGWARSEAIMKKKIEAFEKLYHETTPSTEHFQYYRQWGLKRFLGTHPACMQSWVQENRHPVDILNYPLKLSWSDTRIILADLLERVTGQRFAEYTNFIALE
jgi:hypothetical protein